MKVASQKVLIDELRDMSRSAGECINLLQNAFIYNTSKLLDECETNVKMIHEDEKTLTCEFVEEARKDPEMKAFISVPGHIDRMSNYIEDIIGCIRVKIKEGVLFSDKAVSEISSLLQKDQEILKNISDIILTRNNVVGNYVKESQTEVSRSANEFATMHEERLIEGECMPKASPLFLHILDAIKGIAWNARGIAEKITA